MAPPTAPVPSREPGTSRDEPMVEVVRRDSRVFIHDFPAFRRLYENTEHRQLLMLSVQALITDCRSNRSRTRTELNLLLRMLFAIQQEFDRFFEPLPVPEC